MILFNSQLIGRTTGGSGGGEPGPAGPANVLQIGTVDTLAAGAQATASIVGNSPNQTLNLGIPRGDEGIEGVDGAPNVLTIGTVTTLAAGANATATITGASPNQVLNLSIPRGNDGTATTGTYRHSIFNWTGTLNIPIGAWSNFTALVGLNQDAQNTAGITIGPGGVFKFPAISTLTGVSVRVKLVGTIDGTAATTRGWFVQLRRPDATTVVNSVSVLKSGSADVTGRDVVLTSYTKGLTDPYTVDGVMVGLNNQSGALLTITSMEILIQRFA